MLDKTATSLAIFAIFALFTIFSSSQLTEASDSESRGEFHQQQTLLPHLNSELNLERAKSEPEQRTRHYKETSSTIFLPKQKRQQQQQQQQQYYNGQDIEPSRVVNRLLRFQRSPLNQGGSTLLPLLSQYPANNQQLFEDENAMRRDLPNLIAQARIDKNVERALLKMLINASLRSSSLTNSASPYYYNNADQISTLDSVDSMNETPRVPVRLEQILDDQYAGVDPSASDSSQSAYLREQDQHYQTVMDKREYIKPCSFNAVSCAKNPFRKYK